MDIHAYSKASELLRGDVLRHLSTLKYLALYRDSADVKLVEDSTNWAVLVTFPTRVLSYDTATYPKAKKAVFLNGTCQELKHDLLATLTPDHYLLRLNEDLELSRYAGRFAISKGNVFVSFTCSVLDGPLNRAMIMPCAGITPQAAEILGRNGYMEDEISKYFDNGARWFGLETDGRLASACFVYQNYANVWEIAGVHTIEAERRRGYAAMVVRSALWYLLGLGLIPRYEAEQNNMNSISLARHLKMKEFLTIKHYLLDAR